MHRDRRPSPNLRARLLAGSIWLLAATAAAPTRAETPGPVDVPAGSLDAALTTLAGQTRQQVLYRAELVAGRDAPAVKGTLTSEAALQRLLQGTGIQVKRTGPNVLVLHLASEAPRDAETSPADRPFVADAAQPQALAAPTPAAPALLEEVLVTGSNIRGAPPAAPLRVLDQAELQATGHATLSEALRSLPENFGGGAAEGNTLTGADGPGRNLAYGTALNLRGLGNNATLVLLNGRRVAGSGTFADFVDVSMIPTTAVERVEVLLDGASAVYGADAVGGVVNIILRRDLEGAESQLLAGIGAAGEPAQGRIAHTFGRRWSDGGIVVSYELQRRLAEAQALGDLARRKARARRVRPSAQLVTQRFESDLERIRALPRHVRLQNTR